MMHKNLIAILALASVASGTAFAQDDASAPAFGGDTRALVDLQISNNAALGAPRPMPGEVADRVYSRYVKSFSHPIPERFDREKFSNSGGSSGAGGQ
ncbi:hypothetical protein WQQ_27970 [Hydrocarboniphaga effusa AP103]|jgi:hypothetical protein|uniref:DUF3613 domain-containing protein n=2 Tax=Nevskiaceae TaxID=568386 RepID=I8T5K6_9GAMM|nr:hypothetical protein WQQ_27970 [Hydrocarboniphaga effusa AP103]